MDGRQQGRHLTRPQARYFPRADALPILTCQQGPCYLFVVLLRGGACSLFSEPPSIASLLALSFAIKASRPDLTRAVFSLTPVSFAALSSNLSSMFNVVLIAAPLCMLYHMY